MSRKVSALESLLHNGDIEKVLSSHNEGKTSETLTPKQVSVSVQHKPTSSDASKDIVSRSISPKQTANITKQSTNPAHSQTKPAKKKRSEEQPSTRSSQDVEPTHNLDSALCNSDKPSSSPETTPQLNGQDDEPSIVSLSPETIRPWHLADRPENEIAGIEELADDIKHNGQSSPILVRTLLQPEGQIEYEYIFGCRRLTACQLLQIPVKCMVMSNQSLSDSHAFALMFGENEQRENISSWARSVSFQNVLNSGIYSSKRELSLAIGRNESYIKNLTIYSKIPIEIINAIGPMTNVSINTAQLIESLARVPANINKIVSMGEKIRDGISPKSLRDKINGRVSRSTSQRYSGKKGATLFFTKSEDGNVSIKFSAQDKKPKDFDRLAELLLSYLEDEGQ